MPFCTIFKAIFEFYFYLFLPEIICFYYSVMFSFNFVSKFLYILVYLFVFYVYKYGLLSDINSLLLLYHFCDKQSFHIVVSHPMAALAAANPQFTTACHISGSSGEGGGGLHDNLCFTFGTQSSLLYRSIFGLHKITKHHCRSPSHKRIYGCCMELTQYEKCEGGRGSEGGREAGRQGGREGEGRGGEGGREGGRQGRGGRGREGGEV